MSSDYDTTSPHLGKWVVLKTGDILWRYHVVNQKGDLEALRFTRWGAIWCMDRKIAAAARKAAKPPGPRWWESPVVAERKIEP